MNLLLSKSPIKKPIKQIIQKKYIVYNKIYETKTSLPERKNKS